MKIIIDDTFGYEGEARIYVDYSPAIRSERFGLKVMEIRYELEMERSDNLSV